MIRLAREHSVFYPNIDFQVADVLEWPFPEAAFDCIASIATLHHLPFESLLLEMKAALATRAARCWFSTSSRGKGRATVLPKWHCLPG
jgi:ubiquinone/menaquinone biosynthesis C-methylase UbiE